MLSAVTALHIVQQHGRKPPTPLFFASNGVGGVLKVRKALTE
jgi:hypothetical protein